MIIKSILGRPILSSSYAIRSAIAFSSGSSPVSASLVDYTDLPVGPQGPCAKIITGSTVTIP